MSSSPVLVLDIDGVVSLAQPSSAQPWYATLEADWGFDHDEMALAPIGFGSSRPLV
jgi:putative hydrolase of the HAD superfamily